MTCVIVGILGPVELTDDAGATLRVGSRSQRVVLALLAAEPGRAVPTGRLVEALWGDDPPRSAVSSLRTYVSRLRAVLGEQLRSEGGGYVLDAPTDAARFERALTSADGAAPADALARLDEALGLWRGPAFGDVADLVALAPHVTRLDELRAAACERRAGALLRAGRVPEAVAAAEEVVAEHPYREAAWALLVEGLAAAARPAEALRAHQRAVAVIADAGLVPSEVLRRAERVALAGEAADLGPEVVPVPVPLSSMVGRDDDVEVLDTLHRTARLLTLVGPGGVGKTRLALEVARRVAAAHEYGARVVDLSGVTDLDAVAGVVAASIGLTVDGASPADALGRTGALDLVVVLDNCEQVADAVARAAARMLRSGERLRIVATSRERLAIEGEHVWPVAPLAMGDGGGSAAARLFVDRARAVRPGLHIGDDEAAAVGRIVRRLDGLPLAIEMAAARVGSMSVIELAGRLEERVDVLRSDRRDGDPRHATLRAVVEWSEALLDPRERELFADLAVQAGALPAADVAAVTGRDDVEPTLDALAERSLVVVDTAATPATFGLLSTVRAFAAERLEASGRAARLARRHASHIVEAVRAVDRGLRGPDEAAAHERLLGLLDEALAAHRWALDNDATLALDLSGALHLFAQTRLLDEPMRWAATVVDRVGVDNIPPGGALAVVSAAQRLVHAGDLDGAGALAARAAALATTPGDRSAALEVVSDTLVFGGRLGEALAVVAEMADLAAEAGDRHLVVMAYLAAVLIAAYEGRWEDVDRHLAAVPAADGLSPSDAAWVAYAEGEALLDRDVERSLAALDRAVALADAVGNRYVAGVARVSQSSLRGRAADPRAAAASYGSVIAHWRRQGALTFQVTTLRNLVDLLRRVDACAQAAELLGTLEAGTGQPSFGAEAERLASARDHVRAAVGAAEYDRCHGRGAARSVDEAADLALGWLAALERGGEAAHPSAWPTSTP